GAGLVNETVGGAESTVTVSALERGLTLLASSLAPAWSAYVPSVVTLPTIVQVPLVGEAPPKYRLPLPQYALMDLIPAPVAEVPVTVKVCRLVMLSPLTPVSFVKVSAGADGEGGGVVSTEKLNAGTPLFGFGFTSLPVSTCAPSANAAV